MSTLPTNSLITRKQVKDYMNINAADNVMDNLINDLCGRISQAFQAYCSRDFFSQSYTEYYDGGLSKFIFLDHLPVTLITSIHDDTDWQWGSDKLISSASYRIADERYVVYDSNFAKGEQNIKIVYTAGYSTIPADLQQAAIEEVGRKLKHRTDFDEINKTLTDGSVVFFDKDFMPQTIRILEFYRLKVVL